MGSLNKIIYFDKETISNILQELDKGNKIIQTDTSSALKGEANVELEAKVGLSVPVLKRLGFLFTGKMSTTYIKQRDSKTTITSTEISEFEKLKLQLENINPVQLKDIENSSTFLRVAGGYLRMMKSGVDDVDVKEFNAVMNSYEGYDSYKVSDKIYVRFNNSAFVSNYKRNDLLIAKLDLYCILVGEFDYNEFDFIQQVNKMEHLITGFESNSSLADVFPSECAAEIDDLEELQVDKKESMVEDEYESQKIKLYDVVYASIAEGKKHV